MKKWLVILLVTVLIVGGSASIYIKYFKKQDTTTSEVTQSTEVINAEAGTIETNISGTGNIAPINKELVSAKESGTVDEVLVKKGDTVKEGDELITFENDVDPITAPFSGEITEMTSVEEGSKVQMGMELVEVTDYDHLQMIVNVDELDIAKVKEKQSAKINVTALPDQEFTGKITKVAKEANEDANSTNAKYAVNVEIENPKEIRIGMTAEAVITTDKKDQVVTVPIAAVQKQNDQYFVYVPDQTAVSDGENSEVAMVKKVVEIGLKNEEKAEVVSGLAEGDQVILPVIIRSNNNNQFRPNMFPGGQSMRFGGNGGGMNQRNGNRNTNGGEAPRGNGQ